MAFNWDSAFVLTADGSRRKAKRILRIDWWESTVELSGEVPLYERCLYVTHRWALEIDVRLREVVEKHMGDFLRKAADALTGPAGAVHFRDDALEKQFPALYDFLSCRVGPNGKEREGSCLLVYARNGEVVACLKDRTMKRSWYGRSDSFQDALRMLEEDLQRIQ